MAGFRVNAETPRGFRKEVDLALDPSDLRQRLAKIHLSMAGIVPQRHEYFAMRAST